jgi:hypothetical protein
VNAPESSPATSYSRLKTKNRGGGGEGGHPKDHLKEHPKMFRVLLFKNLLWAALGIQSLKNFTGLTHL